MKVEFRKTPGQHAITIFRDDGVTLVLRPVGRKFSPPHDAVHFIVEQSLGLQSGFRGTIAAGGKMPGMTVLEGRQPPHADSRSRALLRSNRAALNEAEALVGAFQHVQLENPKDYSAALTRRLKGARRNLTPDMIERVWSSLIAFRERWEALDDGDSIVLDWPAARKLCVRRR